MNILPHFFGVGISISPENQHAAFTIMESGSHSNTESKSPGHSMIKIGIALFHPGKDIIITTFPQQSSMEQVIQPPDGVTLICELMVKIDLHQPQKPTFSKLKILMSPEQGRPHSMRPSFTAEY